MALVTDYDCWNEAQAAVSVEAVLAVLKKNAGTANRVLANAVRHLDPNRPSDCADAITGAVLTPRNRVGPATSKRLALFLKKDER
jgi:5'-methylthioadenosine phosphorylase